MKILKPWYKEELEWLKEHYGLIGPSECAKILERTENNIRAIHRNSFKLSPNVWLEDELEILKEKYKLMGSEELSKLLPRFTIGQIRSCKERLGLLINKSSLTDVKKAMWDKILSKRKGYDNFVDGFRDCKTPEHAYILGFLWADGHVEKRNSRVECSIAIEDGKALENVFMTTGKWLTYTKFPKNPRAKEVMIFAVSNKYFHSFLRENDYMIKSGTSADKILSKVPDHLKHYWFRGYFDGDGNVSKLTYTFSISSCENQNWNFMKLLFDQLNIDFIIRIRKHSELKKNNKFGHSSVIRSWNTLNFLRYFTYIYRNYNQDKIGLSRKHNIFVNHVERMKINFSKRNFRFTIPVLEFLSRIEDFTAY